jgi:hypothetical protein
MKTYGSNHILNVFYIKCIKYSLMLIWSKTYSNNSDWFLNYDASTAFSMLWLADS